MTYRIYGCAVAVAAALGIAACDTSKKATDGQTGAVTPAQGTVADAPAVDDASVTMAVQSRYFGSDVVKGRDINVDTRDGVVTLTGVVNSEQEKQQAIVLAKETKGVRRVEEQLRVVSNSAEAAPADRWETNERSPSWITTKIQSQYYLNPELKPWRIDVTTSAAGAVRLSGRVDGENDRAEAVRIARNTEGVTSVDDQLRIEPETAATTGTTAERAEGTAERAGDRASNAAERAGDRAANAAERLGDKASDLANRAAGAVTGAASDLQGSDGWITAKIQSKYFLDSAVKGRDIDVDTREGVVTLRGTVESAGERIQALSIARATDGVRDVRDELRIDTPGIAANETDRTQGNPGRQVNDAWITTRVQAMYFTHDEIKSRNVDVTTKNGVVTLTGTVPTDTAKQAAEELAKNTDGVFRVVNNLRVAGN